MSKTLEKMKETVKKLNDNERYELGKFCLEGNKKHIKSKITLNAIRINIKNFKFDREEANAR